jgi:predicted enzyme related to lactoylglutathione lyase
MRGSDCASIAAPRALNFASAAFALASSHGRMTAFEGAAVVGSDATRMKARTLALFTTKAGCGIYTCFLRRKTVEISHRSPRSRQTLRMAPFSKLELRTTDIEAANRFYRAVLGTVPGPVIQLPPTSAARGAPPHWLPHFYAPDVASTAQGLLSDGCIPLGPSATDVKVLRDPGGAVFAISNATPVPVQVALSIHLSTHVSQCSRSYARHFQLKLHEPLKNLPGAAQSFSWTNADETEGLMLHTAQFPGSHPHWLFYFRVPTLEQARDAVAKLGGTSQTPRSLPNGKKSTACQDPQGAAFGLTE